MRSTDGLFETDLELTPVQEPGQRIVACLVGHLPRQATELGHVMHHQHDTNDRSVGLADR